MCNDRFPDVILAVMSERGPLDIYQRSMYPRQSRTFAELLSVIFGFAVLWVAKRHVSRNWKQLSTVPNDTVSRQQSKRPMYRRMRVHRQHYSKVVWS